MPRFMVKGTLESVSISEAKNEDKAEKEFGDFLQMLKEELEEKYSGTKFKVNYLIQVVELPKEI